MRDENAQAVPERELLPLTAAQRGMWFAETLSPDYSVNTAQYSVIRHEPGGLDLELFAESCHVVGKELEAPYVRLTEVDGVPMQYVDVDFDQTVDILDFRNHSDPEAAAMEWMLAEYRRPVDLVNDQFIVVALLQITDDCTYMYARAHHIIVDGYAALTMLRRTMDRYTALRRGEAPKKVPTATMAEIVEYEDKYLHSTRRETDREYWLSRVTDLPERVTLARTSTNVPLSFDNRVAGAETTPELQARLDELATEFGSSLAVVLTAAFGAFLSRMTGTDDIVLSLPVTGRASHKIKSSGGMVSNVLPIRLREVAQQSIRDLVRSAQLEMTGALRHQRYRTEDIRRDAGLDGGSVSFGPTINMVFFDSEVSIEGGTIEYRILSSGILEDLFINLYQAYPGAPLIVDLHGNPHLYTQPELDEHHRRFLTFVERFVADPDQRIDAIDLLLPGEEAGIVEMEHGPELDPPATPDDEGYLLGLFDQQAAATPDAVAIADDHRTWTYREFDWLRRDLAVRLLEQGVRAGDRVAILLPRGIDQVAAVYAVLSVGAAYVPIDPAQPEQRRAQVIETAGPSLVLDEAWLAGAGFHAAAPAPDSLPALPAPPPADAPAYVLFTSGSTGTPKGVQVSHRAVANRLGWGRRHYGLATDDIVFYKTPITFDVSVPELFAPLQQGARIQIARPDGHRDPLYLREVISDRGVTSVHFVPSMLEVFVDAADPGTALLPASVRRVYASGEALPAPLAAAVVERSDAEVVNLYGPTEAAVEVTEYVVRPGDTAVPIGRPVPRVTTYVLDEQLRRVPAGVAGELYLAGIQLADGYFGSGGLTADRFVADPFDSGARMYRTGDLVRWTRDGTIEYLGRTDFQIKIRGQRVELGDIEAALLEDGVVSAAVAVMAELGGQPAIVGYVKRPADSAALDDETLSDQLLTACAKRLPGYMVPSAVMVVDDFPTNSAGKLDRKQLPVPQVRRESQSYEPPVTDTEIAVVGLLEELLGVERIGIRDNIFALGADSLTAARLVTRARAQSLDIALGDIFESRTVADLARAATRSSGLPARRAFAEVVRPELIPLSHAQTRLWFINRMDPSSAAYNMPGAVRLGAAVDVEVLHAAVADVITRHESLRTRFPSIDGEPVQRIVSAAEAVIEAPLSVRETTESEYPAALAAEAAIGFDLVSQVPVRFVLWQVRDGEQVTDHVLAVILHHISGDGASLPPLIDDLFVAYTARAEGREPDWEPLQVHYADYAIWHRELLGDAADPASRLRRELDFWTEELAGVPEVLPLPTDFARPVSPTGAGGYVDTVLDGDLVERIRRLAADHGVTPFTVLHVALAALLARLSSSDDIAVGTAVAGRDEPETARLVGMLVNTVVLRNRIHPGDTVTALLREAGHTRTRALEHAQAPFEQVVEAVGAQRSLAHNPLFQVSLTLITDHRTALQSDEVTALDARVPAAKYDLALAAVDVPGEGGAAGTIELEFSYATELFTEETVARFADYFATILAGMTEAPERPIGLIDLMPADTVAALTAPVVSAPPVTLRDIFAEAAAAADPQQAAVVGAVSISNQVFDMRSSQLARELLARGAGPGEVVALAMPRSPLSVLAMVAVVKTGAAFVAIDPRYPDDRRAAMLADSGALVVITSVDAEIVDASGLGWIVLDDEATELQLAGHSGAPIADAELPRRPQPDDPAYLLFTSGSTGAPKATVVPNRGLANLVVNQHTHFGVTPESRVLHVSSPSFDASVLELTLGYCAAAPLVVADMYTFGGEELEAVIAEHGVTHAFMTPAAMSTLDPVAVPTLATVISGGDVCPPELMRRWVDLGRRFFNIYGPTETTVWTTIAGPFRRDESITIGKPAEGVGAMVLDSGLRPTPVGVVGELYLTGSQVALGYLHQMPMTATRFVADPFDVGGRMYRTGDRVVRLADGRLLYYGRSDFQMKVRGMRIEPGEVDAVLVGHPGVANASSLGVEGPGGDSVLVSYVSPRSQATLFPDEVIAFAAERLPAHMVPQSVIVVEEFPLTPVGKIDRKRLPAVDFSDSQDFVAPRTQLEGVIAEVYAQVLGLERVSIHDGFFELGGNSLSAIKLTTQLSKVVGRSLAVKSLFEAPSVAEIAELVETLNTGHASPPLVARSRAELVPVSDVQRGMWLVNRADPESPAYNIALALRLDGDLDLAALRNAVADLLRRQEALRTSYPMIDGQPTQIIHPADEIVAGLRLAVTDVEGTLQEAVARVTGEGFDVTAAPPVRLALLRTAPDQHVLVFVIHHISADGSSMNPLARDLMTAYAARVAGHVPDWSPLRVQYADYVQWQIDRLAVTDGDGVTERDRQLAYWKQRLAGAPETITLPTDRPRPPSPTFAGDKAGFEIPADLVNALEGVARARNTTLFMVTHAALAVLLGRLSGQQDVVVGTPYAGRPEPVLDDIVGMFVNTMALRTRLNPTESFAELLDQVRAEDLNDLAHTDVAFDSVVAEIGASRSASFNPVFQAMFWFQNIDFPTVTLGDLTITPVSEELVPAKVDLQLTLYPNDPAVMGETAADAPMRAEFLYATDLFDAETIERHAQRYLKVLEEIAENPQIIVGDISIATRDEIAAVAEPPQEAATPLPELVAAAAAVDPNGAAFEGDGVAVTFASLSTMTTAMAAALPDTDSALVTALMSLAPGLAAGGPDQLGSALDAIRNRATGALQS